jgi:hypothetical protein
MSGHKNKTTQKNKKSSVIASGAKACPRSNPAICIPLNKTGF